MIDVARGQRVIDDAMEAGARIFEHFATEDPTVERSVARRVFLESTRQWPGDSETRWAQWLQESATSLSLQCKSIEGNIDLAIQHVRAGVPVISFRASPEMEWVAVMSYSGRRFNVNISGEEYRSVRMTAKQLHKLLNQHTDSEGNLNGVVVLPPGIQSTATQRGEALGPIERLRMLLRPEWSDIWIVIVFAFVVGLLMLAPPIAVESLVNTVAFGRVLQPVIVLALILFSFLGFLGAMRALQTYVVEIIQRRLFARVAADLAYRLPRVQTEAADEHHMPELVNRFFDVVTVQKVTAKLFLDGLELLLIALIGMGVLAFYHPWLLGFDIFLLASIVVIIVVLGRGAVKSAIKESKSKYFMAAWLEDVARCSTSFRSEGGNELAMERTDRLVHQYLLARRDHFRVLMRQIMFALGLQAIASTVLLGLGGWLVIAGELTLGQLVAAELIVTMIVGTFSKIGKHMESFYDLLASVDKLGALFDLPMDRQDGALGTGDSGAIDVDVHAATYSWPDQPSVIDSVNISIAAGTSMAVLGKSGSGKSTLMDLLYGLRAPTAGYVTLNGFDPRDVRPDILRTQVALVRGDEVFQGTVEENIHLHRSSVSASDCRDVLEKVGLLPDILKLDDGMDSELLSSGAPLSPNQRVLLGIARAIVGGPGLILIDGVLDALPDEDFEKVWAGLTAPDNPWTIAVATGRRDIAKRCAELIVLDQTTPGALIPVLQGDASNYATSDEQSTN